MNTKQRLPGTGYQLTLLCASVDHYEHSHVIKIIKRVMLAAYFKQALQQIIDTHYTIVWFGFGGLENNFIISLSL
jgi:hypothetical protein